MSKRLHKPGQFLRIELPDGSFGYGRCPLGADQPTILTSDGRQWKATLEECIGLERIAVWEAHNVVSRIVDETEGRENAFAAQTRIGEDGAR